MKDQSKTKTQLIEELETLRKQIVKLKKVETKRKQAEDSLRESQARFHTVFEKSATGIGLTDIGGRLLNANPAFLQMLGYTGKELTGKSFLEFTHPDDLEKERESFRQLEQGKSDSLRMEKRYVRKDGQLVWANLTASLCRNDKGVPQFAIGMVEDITERKKAEKTLRESEERLSLAIEGSNGGLWDLEFNANDPLGSIPDTIYISPDLKRIIGYEDNEFPNSMGDWKGRIIPEDLVLLNKSAEDHLKGLKDLHEAEYRIFHKDGSIRWIYTRGKILRDKNSRHIRWSGVDWDITDRKRAAEALRKAEEKYRNIFYHAIEGIFQTTPEGAFISANPALARIHGYDSPEELINTITDIGSQIHVDPNLRSELTRLLAERKVVRDFEAQVHSKDGSRIWISLNIKAVHDTDGRLLHYEGTIQDITERKRAEEKVRLYEEQLRSLISELSLVEEEERRRIATDLHDHIGQILALAKIKLESLREMASSTGLAVPLDPIREMIEQAIQYTRTLTFELSPPILYELGFEAAVEWLTEQIQEQHGILVGFEDDLQPKPMSHELRILLFKAVRELVINIVKHAQARSAKVSIRRDDKHIHVLIRDDGYGFNPFKDNPSGKMRGFGLFSIRERLKHFGGNFEIESNPGHGTRVTLVAPLNG